MSAEIFIPGSKKFFNRLRKIRQHFCFIVTAERFYTHHSVFPRTGNIPYPDTDNFSELSINAGMAVCIHFCLVLLFYVLRLLPP